MQGQQRQERLKPYRFRPYERAREQFKISDRMATAACIRRVHAEIIQRTEVEIDKRHLNSDGMTEVGFFEGATLYSAIAGNPVAIATRAAR